MGSWTGTYIDRLMAPQAEQNIQFFRLYTSCGFSYNSFHANIHAFTYTLENTY